MHVKLYEDIARFGVSQPHAYLCAWMIATMDPSPIPKFDNSKMDEMEAATVCAGREKRIYAIPPYTRFKLILMTTHLRFSAGTIAVRSVVLPIPSLIVMDDDGNHMFVCSDTDFCQQQVVKNEVVQESFS